MEKEAENKREASQQEMKEIERRHAEAQAKIAEMKRAQPIQLLGLEEWLRRYDLVREFNLLSSKRTQVATFFNCYVGLEILKTLKDIRELLDPKSAAKSEPEKIAKEPEKAERKRG